MAIDAVLLLRVKSKPLFRDAFERMGLPPSCLDPLDDGSVLVSTLQTFGVARETTTFELRTLVTRTFGTTLPDIHDDARGILAFPDVCEPRARTYEGVVAEIGEAGLWLPLAAPSKEEMLARMTAMLAEVDTLVDAPTGSGASGSAEAFRASGKATAAADARELEAELARMRHESLDAMVSDAARKVGDDVSFACVLLQAQPAPPTPLPDGVNAIHRLPDGTWVIVTTRLSTATDLVALSLGEEWKAWQRDHADPRGALVFSATHLARVLECADYAAATRSAEASDATAAWVRPVTVEELIAQRGERGQRFLDE